MQMWVDSTSTDMKEPDDDSKYSPWRALASSLQSALGVSLCLNDKHMELFHAHWESARRCAGLLQSLSFPELNAYVVHGNQSQPAPSFSPRSIYRSQGSWYTPKSAPYLLPTLSHTRAFVGSTLVEAKWLDGYNNHAHVLFPESSQHPGSDMIVIDQTDKGQLHVTFVEVMYSEPDFSTTTYQGAVQDKLEKTMKAYEWMWSGNSPKVPGQSHVAFVFAAFRKLGDICPKDLAADTRFGGTIGVLDRKALQSVYGHLLMPLVVQAPSAQRSAHASQ
jgi:hypothetical protein